MALQGEVIEGNLNPNGPSLYIRVIGIPQAKTRMQAYRFMSGPMREFLVAGGYIVKKHSQDIMIENESYYTGATFDSVETEVDTNGLPMWVKIGSNLPTAEYLEMGTRPHFPNLDAISDWALDHGWDPWELAVHISESGTQPHPFLMPGLVRSIPEVFGLVQILAKAIEARAAA